MKGIRSHFGVSLVLALGWVCRFGLVAVPVHAELVDLRVLGTTDVHAFIEEGDVLEGGGWLRLATLIRKERGEAGADHTILIDCGDSVQGTLVGRQSRGQVGIDLLKFLAYDVWVPGNHELDFGVERLWEMGRALPDMVLCGNLRLRVAGEWEDFRGWRVIERGGAKVVVIGATASYMGNWFWGDGYDGFATDSARSMLEEQLPAIHREEADLIVLAIHQGWMPTDERRVNEVAAIAQRFPEIDLILGGHTHWEHAGRRVGPRTWYVQAGRHGASLAVATVRVDTEKHRVVQIESALLPTAETVVRDRGAAPAVGRWLRETQAFSQRSVGLLSAPLSAEGDVGVSCETSELLSAAIAEASGAKVVIHGRLSRHGVAAGKVTEGDIFELVPYENSIGVAMLTERQLMAIIEEQVAKRESYVACGLYGAVATFDGGGKVTHLVDRDGRPLSGRVAVAFNSYTLAGAGGRFPVLHKAVREEDARLRDIGIGTHEVLRRYFGKHRPVEVKVKRWYQFPTD